MSDSAGGMGRWYKHGKVLLDEIANSGAHPGEALVWFAGQHGFIIKLPGAVLYIDVILNDFTDSEGNSRRVYPPPFEPGEARGVDYVLCTHNHGDHLNLKTLLPLAASNPRARFVVPAPFTRLLVEAGIDASRVSGARAGEALGLAPGYSLVPVQAVHTLRVRDEGERDERGDFTALGYVIKAEGLTIYHSGDTWVTPSLVRALGEQGPLDLAMLPINGSDWERTGRNCIGNMSYLDAAKLAKAVPIDTVIPSHYDMMAFNSENPARFAEAMYALHPEKRFHILALGERFIYRKERL